MKQFDARTERVLRSLDPKAQPRFRKWLEDATEVALDFLCDYRLISGNRSWDEQDCLYAQGRKSLAQVNEMRDKIGLPPIPAKDNKIVTNARGGYSNHNFKIAVDAGVFSYDGKQYYDETNRKLAHSVHKAVAKDAGDYGFEWGGNWRSTVDMPHFEIDTGLTMPQKRLKFQKHGSVL